MTEHDDALALVELLWIPLGAGQRVVRLSGGVFERVVAFLQRRPSRPLYHSALVVTLPGCRYVIEMTPVVDDRGDRRGVVGGGAVGSAWLGRWRLFRYEIHCWCDGVIPDADQAAATIPLDLDPAAVLRIVDLVGSVPTPVWGRDELDAGEMWNSNSVTAWILKRLGVDAALLAPPDGGRAPGWDAGVVVARRANRVRSSPRVGVRRC